MSIFPAGREWEWINDFVNQETWRHTKEYDVASHWEISVVQTIWKIIGVELVKSKTNSLGGYEEGAGNPTGDLKKGDNSWVQEYGEGEEIKHFYKVAAKRPEVKSSQ